MLPLWPESANAPAAPSAHLLGVVEFATGVNLTPDPHPRLTLSVPPLGSSAQRIELWRSAMPVRHGCRGDIVFARNDEALFGAIVSDEADVERAVLRAYREILDLLRAEQVPHLLRVWNHVRDINGGQGDAERYKRFCAGRHEALVGAGWARGDFPAASAVGMRSGELAIYFVASRTRGTHVENPRQVSAYDYPRRYGQHRPSFARATATRFGSEALLFISGTSSVVGYETQHPGVVVAQLRETLTNLDRIATAAGEAIGERSGLGAIRFAKTYLRRASDYAVVAAELATALPAADILFAEADICRADLLLEIEAVGSVASTARA
jgi:chorismate lyase/3-hydroxybenzoate synthase